MVALLVFIMAILAEKKRKEKKLLDAKGPFAGKVFKNLGSYIFSIYEYNHSYKHNFLNLLLLILTFAWL